jgi:hypothetical protein
VRVTAISYAAVLMPMGWRNGWSYFESCTEAGSSSCKNIHTHGRFLHAKDSDEVLAGSLLAQHRSNLDRTAIAEVRHDQLSNSSTFIPFADVPKPREGVDPDDDIMIDIKTETIQKGRASNER